MVPINILKEGLHSSGFSSFTAVDNYIKIQVLSPNSGSFESLGMVQPL